MQVVVVRARTGTRPRAGLRQGFPAIASTGVRAFAFTLGVLALLRMSVFTYFVE